MKDAKSSISANGMQFLPPNLETLEFHGLIGYNDFLKKVPKNIQRLRLYGEFDPECIKVVSFHLANTPGI